MKEKNLNSLQPQGAFCDINQLLRLRFAANELKLFARKKAASMLAGNVQTRFRGRGIDFEEVRTYQPGDDIRSIDWRVTARTQVPHTKLFSEERERPVFIVTDQRSPMFFGSHHCFKSVLAAHVTATLAWAALANSDRVGAMLFGDDQQRDIRPRRSKHAVLELIHQLTAFNQRLSTPVASENGIDLNQILTDTRRIAKPGSAVFIVSDFHDWNDRSEEQLFQIARHTDVSLIQISDALEQKLPTGGVLTVSNGEQRLQVATTDRSTRQRFSEHFKQHQQQLLRSCQRLGVPLISITTDDDVIGVLRDLYGKQRKR